MRRICDDGHLQHLLLKFAVSFPGILITFPIALTLVLFLHKALLKGVTISSKSPVIAGKISPWNLSMGIFGVLSNVGLLLAVYIGWANISGAFVAVAAYATCGLMAVAMLWRLKATGFRFFDFAQSLTIFLGSSFMIVNLLNYVHTFSGSAISWLPIIGGTAFLFLEMLAVYILLVRTKNKDEID